MSRGGQRKLVVASSEQLTPNMQRIVFTGEELKGFPQDQESGYIKLLFPKALGGILGRNTMRTYTIRHYDAVTNKLTVDFALHNHSDGPASSWAKTTKPGDNLSIAGPGAVKLVNNSADWFFLVGDMTALPALACNLEQLPENASGYAVIEITSEQDKQSIKTPSGIERHWVINPEPHVHQPSLVDKVKSLPWKNGIPSVWTACEFHSMRKLREYFKFERQVAKENIYISSYWKIDRTEEQHKKDKQQDQLQVAAAKGQ